MNKKRKDFLVTIALFALLLVILFVPMVRMKIHEGLMALGFFKPKIETPEVQTPPDFSLSQITFINEHQEDVNGQTLEGKVVFINFWATWCPPCLYEMPSIQKLKEHFQNQEDVVFLMVDVDADLDGATQFLKNKEFDLPVYVMATSIPESWLGNAIPCTIVLDKKGQLVYRQEGAANYDRSEFKDFMQKLINETP